MRLLTYSVSVAVTLCCCLPVFPADTSAQPKQAPATQRLNAHVVDEVKADDATALLNRGIKLEAEGRTQDAMECFHRAISMDHYNANAFFNLGVVAEKHGDLQGALQNYRIAASISPNDAEFREAVGAMQAQLTASQPAFAAPPYMVPQRPVYEQPAYQTPVVSTPYHTPPVVGVSEPARKGHPYIRATASVAAVGAAALLMGRGIGGLDISCPLCRMLGGL
jgi:tetratricopeptide (TPR) repeat protein